MTKRAFSLDKSDLESHFSTSTKISGKSMDATRFKSAKITAFDINQTPKISTLF